MKRENIPNPGSHPAVKRGCECPVLDNHRGFGYMGREGEFVTNASCPPHGEGTDWWDADDEMVGTR